jgi:hypothetical protein
VLPRCKTPGDFRSGLKNQHGTSFRMAENDEEISVLFQKMRFAATRRASAGKFLYHALKNSINRYF